MMSERPFANVGELIRFALVCAIRDREGMADCDPGPYGEEARAEAKAFRAYMKKRFGNGRTPAERALDGVASVSIYDLKPNPPTQGEQE